MRKSERYSVNFTWKKKILDYEIEIEKATSSPSSTLTHLKKKDSRLRDWNSVLVSSDIKSSYCLKKKDSRLRDWNESHRTRTEDTFISVLKRKDSRLRDWNPCKTSKAGCGMMAWKKKILDYEIEISQHPNTHLRALAWKKKILDYEIEIWEYRRCGQCVGFLEKKRFSITRLK